MYKDLKLTMVKAILDAEKREDAAANAALRMTLGEFLCHYPNEFQSWNELYLTTKEN